MTEELVDDASVGHDSLLLRRIPIQWRSCIVWDANKKYWRPSSQMFKNHKDNALAISVNLKIVLDELGQPVESVIRDPGKYALAAVPAGLVRQYNQVIQKKPEKDDPSHGHVLGAKDKSVQTALAEAAIWVIAPPDQPAGG